MPTTRLVWNGYWLSIFSILMSLSAAKAFSPRLIEKVIPATATSGPIKRLIGSVDVDGKGTQHSLFEVDPCMLLDQGVIAKNNMPPFGAHPHRGHSVVTILMQGKMSSWDSVSHTKTTITGPSSYWVNAGSGLFHDEVSVIEDESDTSQHVVLFQLWVGVKESDRLQPPSLGFAKDLPKEAIRDADGTTDIGTVIHYVGGSGTQTKDLPIPRPLTVSQIHQQAGTTYRLPIPAGHSGFLVNISGDPYFDKSSKPASFAGKTPTKPNDVLVLAKDDTASATELEIKSQSDAPSDYLVCVGEPHASPWFKKLGSNGAIIAQTADEARAIAADVATFAEQGKTTGDFSPFGTKPPSL